MHFEITHRDPGTRARAGLLHTPHGVVETPVFMPVGTAGTVKGIDQRELEAMGVQILLGNTYHLYLRPGHEIVREFGGLHGFMGWPAAILTDSGGYQVMSLEGLGKASEEGYEFRSHLDGSRHFFSPERAVEIQLALGSDIMMALDRCVEYPASPEATARATELTALWAERCRSAYVRERDSGFEPRVSAGPPNQDWRGSQPGSEQGPGEYGPPGAAGAETETSGAVTGDAGAPALFGIVQGGIDPELRRQSAESMIAIGFEGYAVGGLSVGEPKAATYDLAEYTAGLLPRDRPRYLMGVGTPLDLVECVARGIDMFDCVMPTRHARNGSIFTSQGRLAIKNARHARDPKPLDPACSCPVCRRYSRGYIRHLFGSGEMLGPMLATRHNLQFYLDTMREIRDAIRSGEYNEVRSRARLGLCAAEAPDS